MHKKVHIPVMSQEVISYLSPKEDGIYVDMTVGAGGHSSLIAEAIGENGKIIGIDRDNEILEIARKTLECTGKSFSLHQSPFSKATEVLDSLSIRSINGVLFDFGISSYQLSKAERGFSFANEGPLDMRMNPQAELTAEMIVNGYSQEDLTAIFFEYGEESRSRTIAREIVKRRRIHKIRSTLELANLVSQCYGGRRGKIHPATKIFQALRIEVNNELTEIRESIEKIIPYMAEEAKIVIISFHSLEDRIVKRFFKSQKEYLEILTKKPLIASEQEKKRKSKKPKCKTKVCQKESTMRKTFIAHLMKKTVLFSLYIYKTLKNIFKNDSAKRARKRLISYAYFFILIGTMVFFLFFLVKIRIQTFELGYQIAQMEKEKAKLEENIRYLTTKKTKILSSKNLIMLNEAMKLYLLPPEKWLK